MVIATELAALQKVTLPLGLALVFLAVLGAVVLADPRAGLLAGVPGLALSSLGLLGREPLRRRVCMVLATTCSGFLAIAGAPGLTGLAGGGLLGPATYQATCFALAGLHLGLAWPAWRRANAAGDRARAVRALYDEV